MPTKVTNQMPGLEYDKNMVCEDFLNMGMLPLETCRALAGGTGPQPQHLAIRHIRAIEVKNILVLDLIKDTQLMDML
jgi:hypothetical protein